jgi:hypothetical protein
MTRADEWEVLTGVGDTYPHRAALKKMGGLYDRRTRLWVLPKARIEEARALVGPPATRAPRPRPWPYPPGSERPAGWEPCGYPGCHWTLCDDCDGAGWRPRRR